MTHIITWAFDGDHVTGTLRCTDDDCIERYHCNHGCTSYSGVTRHPDGRVTHGQWTEREFDPHHEMTRGDECNFVVWLEADPSLLPELNERREKFDIGQTAVQPVWDIEDGPTWTRTGADEDVESARELVKLVRERVGGADGYEIVGRGRVGEPSLGALLLRLAAIVEKHYGTGDSR